MENDEKKGDLRLGQRGTILVVALVMLFFLALSDGLVSFEINEVVLTAFIGFVGAGGAYFYKAKTDEAKLKLQ